MSENKDSNKKSELLIKLDELLENVGDKYGPFMIEELYQRMEKTINEFNNELDTIFESSFEQSKKINNVVREAMESGSTPNLSDINLGQSKDIPNFISDKNKSKASNQKVENDSKVEKKKRSFFSRKKKK
tara:strand:- start:194 stop:583 length:390 start_codon:yes stop_codon:yes gene_type:complete